MKNKHRIQSVQNKCARPDRPHLRLLPLSASVKSERQRQEEDELRTLIKALHKREQEGAAGKAKRSNSRLSTTEEDFPPAA